MSTLDISTSVVIYEDTVGLTNNPTKRAADFTRYMPGIASANALTVRYVVPAGQSQVIFSGVDATTIDGTTAFTTTLNPALVNTYRFTYVSGTLPGFRTDRGLNLSGASIATTINNNASMKLTKTGPGTFTGALVGDVLFIPGPTTGDSVGVFNTLNEGFWKVIAVNPSGGDITVVRLAGQSFQGVAETVTVTNQTQIQVYTSTGVQVNDSVIISAGFSSVTWGNYKITQVTPKFFEIVSTLPLALETSILPTATGLVFYNRAKKYVRIDSDQPISARCNADITDNNLITPVNLPDGSSLGFMEKLGLTYALTIVNKNPVADASVLVVSCE